MRHRILFILLFWLGLSTSATAQDAVDLPYKSKLEAAETKLRTGDFTGAITILDEITTAYPDAADVFYAKGLLFGQTGNYSAAIDNARIAYDKKTNLQSLNLLLDLYRAGDRPDDLVNTLRDFRTKNPTMTFVSRELISTLAALDRVDEAYVIFDEEIKANQGSDTLTVLKANILIEDNDPKAAIALLDPLSGRSTFSPTYSALAYAYRHTGKIKSGIRVLENGLKLTRDPVLYLDLADAYREDKKPRQDYESLVKAFDADQVDFGDKHRVMLSLMGPENGELTLDQIQTLANSLVLRHPRIAESHLIKGNILWQRGNMQEARSIYLTAVGINPKQLDAWRMLINADLSLKLVEDGVRHGQEALAANPGNPMLLYFTGLAYLAKEDYDNSRQMLETALDRSENENEYLRSIIYGTLGDLYHQLEMHAASDVAYEEAISLDSTNITVLNNYAYYLALRKKDLDKAEEYSRRSIELEPSSATLQDTYAWVLFQQGRYQEALSWIEKAMSGNVSAVLHEHYGDILSMVGREKDALKQWEKALAMQETASAEAEKIELKIKNRKYVE